MFVDAVALGCRGFRCVVGCYFAAFLALQASAIHVGEFDEKQMKRIFDFDGYVSRRAFAIGAAALHHITVEPPHFAAGTTKNPHAIS